jgi:hypothetical protein
MIAVWGFWRSPLNGLGARPRVLLAERSMAPLLRYAESFRELVPKHGHSTLGFVFGSFVLNYVPVLGENVVFDRLRAENCANDAASPDRCGAALPA